MCSGQQETQQDTTQHSTSLCVATQKQSKCQEATEVTQAQATGLSK